MAEFNDEKSKIRQNLIDAGCDECLTNQCMSMCEQDEIEILNKTLSKHRRSLLDNLHQAQYKIDCLDYLKQNLEKNRRNK